MANQILQQVRQAVSHLNPQEVRDTAERPLAIRLAAATAAGYAAMEEFFSPATRSPGKQREQRAALFREGDPDAPAQCDLEIYETGLSHPEEAFEFSPEDPARLVSQVLSRREELGLPLARYFAPFRPPVVDRIITGIAKENALFALATALPDVAPGLIELPWSVAEIGSDTAFITVNQIRMLFLLAGASDHPVGYREQRSEIASVIAGAFGWRALARELVGKIPFGAGLVPKAAVAFAGTYVVGRSVERLYRIGYGYTREERRRAYGEALERGKQVARSLLEGGGRRKAATEAGSA